MTGSVVNNDVGTLAYAQVRNAGIHAVTSAGGVNYSYDKYGNMVARGSESIIYDTFNKPTRIAGASITDFYYGPDHELYKEVSGTKTTYKLAGGSYEVIVDGSTTTQKSYVDGVIMNNRVLIGGTQSANDTVYLHTDHLGSFEATTNALGQFVNRMSFGAWGERQKADWKPGSPTETFLTTNGFTGHDQLDSHNLVHMGGRVYDPNLGRFLSADLFIQSPYDSQSFNRYSYTFNNPLSYTDPSGYSSEIFTYLMNQSYHHSSSWMWSNSVYQAQTQINNLQQIKQQEQQYADLQNAGIIDSYEDGIPADYYKTWSTGQNTSATFVQCGEGCARTLLSRSLMGTSGLSPSDMMSLLKGLETASYLSGVAGLGKAVAGKVVAKEGVGGVDNIVWPPNRGFDGDAAPASLIPGVKIDRYGSANGTFVAPAGTPFPMRALPESSKVKSLSTYEVLKPIRVDAGPAAPWFKQPGGGLQFELPNTVQELLNTGYLRQIN